MHLVSRGLLEANRCVHKHVWLIMSTEKDNWNPPAMREARVQSLGRKIPWRRKRLPTPVFWPGEFYGPYSPWSHKESDTIERLSLHFRGIN